MDNERSGTGPGSSSDPHEQQDEKTLNPEHLTEFELRMLQGTTRKVVAERQRLLARNGNSPTSGTAPNTTNPRYQSPSKQRERKRQDPSSVEDLSTVGGPQYSRYFGTPKVNKGKFNGVSLFYSWDAVPFCREEDCPIFVECPYNKGRNIRCNVHSQFLKSLSLTLYRNFADVMDEPRLYRVGIHLMPLYKMLCKLLIQEHAVADSIYTDSKGVIRANPIHKEIRDTLVAISKEWRSIGIDVSPGDIEYPDPLADGDPYFHESLEED